MDLILVEDKSAGISLIQDLQRAHLPVRAYNPGRADKVQRLNIVSNIIARGRVWIPESSVRKGYVRDWAEGMVSQICSFPDVQTAIASLKAIFAGASEPAVKPALRSWEGRVLEINGAQGKQKLGALEQRLLQFLSEKSRTRWEMIEFLWIA